MNTTTNKPLIRLLLVEDDQVDRLTCKRALEKNIDCDFVFFEAETGAQGIQLARSEQPDCILLDQNLPDFNGIEFLAELNGKNGEQPIPVVMLTGSDNAMLAVEALKKGAYDYVVKGIEREPLQRLPSVVLRAIRECQSILEKAQTEKVLEQRGRLIELSFEPIFIWDMDKGIAEWNRGCEQLYGYTHAEAVGRVSHQLLQTRFSVSLAEAEERLRADGIWAGELCHVARDGREVIVDSRWQMAEICGSKLVLESNRDITERKQKEELQYAVDRAEIAQEAARATLYEYMPQTGAVVRNPSFDRVLGYAPDENPTTGEAWRGLIHPDDRKATWAAIEQGIESGEGFSLEYRVRHKDGHYIWMYDRARVHRDAEGTAYHIIGMVVDITERKQTEQALHESEERLSLAKSAASIGIWDWKIRENQTAFSTEYYALFGLPQNIQHTYTDFLTLVHPEDRELVDDETRAVLESGQPFDIEYRIMRASDGVTRWIADKGKVTFDEHGQARRFLGVVYDITEHKQLEAELRIAAAAFETQECILVTDPNYVIQRVNKAFTHITGYSPEEAIGNSPTLFHSGLHDEAFYKNIFAVVTKEGYWQGEVWHKRNNSEIFPVFKTVTKVVNEKNETTHFVVVILDITAQKQAEKVLLEARDRLEKQVATTQEELEKNRVETDEINMTLDVLLKHREKDKETAKISLTNEVEAVVMPLLKRLKNMAKGQAQTLRVIGTIEDNLMDLMQTYGRTQNLDAAYQKLTAVERQVAAMVKLGQPTKVIAAALNSSPQTVETHRRNIRKKLGLDTKTNLFSYLQSLSSE